MVRKLKSLTLHFNIQDNSESEIGDMIHQAMDAVQRELEDPQESNVDLIPAFDNRNVLNCIENVHKWLGDKYLNTQKVFKNLTAKRKEDIGTSHCKDLRELNLKLRKCSRIRLSSLYLSRGDLHQTQHKYQSAMVDFQQSLVFNCDKTKTYQIFHKLAQSQAKLGKAIREELVPTHLKQFHTIVEIKL